MSLGSQPAFQNDGAFQLAEQLGFQTQTFTIWTPVPEPPGGPWTPSGEPGGGPWIPNVKPTGPWTPVT